VDTDFEELVSNFLDAEDGFALAPSVVQANDGSNHKEAKDSSQMK
jgi:hypothetical protein